MEETKTMGDPIETNEPDTRFKEMESKYKELESELEKQKQENMRLQARVDLLNEDILHKPISNNKKIELEEDFE